MKWHSEQAQRTIKGGNTTPRPTEEGQAGQRVTPLGGPAYQR